LSLPAAASQSSARRCRERTYATNLVCYREDRFSSFPAMRTILLVILVLLLLGSLPTWGYAPAGWGYYPGGGLLLLIILILLLWRA
jgi:uncharacterized protein DUF3309